jgi:hypothetical protein
MDVLLDVGHDVLAAIAHKPGGCIPINHDELLRLSAVAAQHGVPVRCVHVWVCVCVPARVCVCVCEHVAWRGAHAVLRPR